MKLHNYIFLIGFISFGQESNLKINSLESIKLFDSKFSKELIFPQYLDAISSKI